jgi:hypothetical protein
LSLTPAHKARGKLHKTLKEIPVISSFSSPVGGLQPRITAQNGLAPMRPLSKDPNGFRSKWAAERYADVRSVWVVPRVDGEFVFGRSDYWSSSCAFYAIFP